MDRVGVCRGDHVGACGMDLGVDGEGGGIHGPVSLDDLAAIVDEDEVPDPDELEIHPRPG